MENAYEINVMQCHRCPFGGNYRSLIYTEEIMSEYVNTEWNIMIKIVSNWRTLFIDVTPLLRYLLCILFVAIWVEISGDFDEEMILFWCCLNWGVLTNTCFEIELSVNCSFFRSNSYLNTIVSNREYWKTYLYIGKPEPWTNQKTIYTLSWPGGLTSQSSSILFPSTACLFSVTPAAKINQFQCLEIVDL